ncbi:MAG TPA: MBL fold metallo-hydrolase [Streptosporangiaceae bacterium]|jgi:ribonuclease BN (tRNA processing enzyme)|nr:MBL fold metallo-hydrolase [Streptosporangiaceae bacterium]
MRLTIIGCSGSFPGPESPASSYLLEAEGFRLLLDLGNGALGVLQRHASLYEIDAVALSHLHADHCIDMASYWVARRYAPGGPKPAIPVYAPDRAAERLTLAYGLEPDPGPGMTDAFTFRTLAPGTRPIGPFQVTTARMAHPVETYGFRIEHGGRVLAYSADTGPTEALVELARGADLLLSEASFLDGPDLPRNLHLTGRQAGEHAARAGARHLVLTHLVPGNDKQRSFAEAEAVFGGPISLAASGQEFDLAPAGALPL